MEWLDRTLLVSPICFGLCKDEESFKKELKRLGIKKKDRPDFMKNGHSDATAHFFDTSNNASHCCIVCVPNNKKATKVQIYALLVHEAVHIWQHIKENIGERWPGAEQEAYAIQNISQELFMAYNRK